MPYRIIPFVTGNYYHLYNRGLRKQNIFANNQDYKRFIKTFFYYQIQNPKPKFSLYQQSQLYKIDPTQKIVEILCYCLMPNHFHLLIKQTKDNGVSEFMRKFIHSYTAYSNTKNNTLGPLFQGMFKAKLIESDEQLFHLSRYIHLNPLTSLLVKDLKFYPWSSYHSYINSGQDTLAKEDILSFFNSPQNYEEFVLDQADYGTTLELLKHQVIDIEK